MKPKLPGYSVVKTIKSFDDLIDALTVHGVVYIKSMEMVQNKHWIFVNARIGWLDKQIRDGQVFKIIKKSINHHR